MNQATIDWLCESLQQGEASTWQGLAATLPAGVTVPMELIALAKADESAPDRTSVGACSAQLRRICIQTPTAAGSAVLAAACMIRISALGYEDAEWAGLMPRWLVPTLSPYQRGIALLALALNSRDRLSADDYADIMDEAIRLLPPAAPLRGAHTYQYALYLGLRGMLRRISDIVDLPRPGDPEPEVDPAILAECFYDAICCGRSNQAAFLENKLLATPETAWQLGLFHMHRVFVPVFHAILAGDPLPEAADVPSLPLLRALLEDDRDVLESYSAADPHGEVTPLLSFDGLRVLLTCRELESARRILESRSHSTERHWLDDLFWARLLLLEDKPLEAGAAFARLEAAATRYGAFERVEIELRLAGEMSLHDCCRLGSLATLASRPSPAQVAAIPRTSQANMGEDEALLAGQSAAASSLRHDVHTMVAASPSRILLLGPADGSRRSLAAILHHRFGHPSQLRYVHAVGNPNQSWIDHCSQVMREPGTVIIDDLDNLGGEAQALLPQVMDGAIARIICAASPVLLAAVQRGSFRTDLFWSIAEWRLHLPGLEQRADDLPELITALNAVDGGRLRWESPARASIVKASLPGGWAQLRLLARMLGRSCSPGSIDVGSLDAALASLNAGLRPVAG